MDQKHIDELASSLHEWLSEHDSNRTEADSPVPTLNEIVSFLQSRVGKVVEEDAKLPVLLRQSPNSKRMRELAGIPHKDNFV